MEGLGACAGLVTGLVVFTKEQAIACTEPCILVTKETTPNDFAGMVASAGILTQTGGTTSHAAVVARGMDKACVVGATDLEISDGHATANGKSFGVGCAITINGDSGEVWIDEAVPVIEPEQNPDVQQILQWAGVENAGPSLITTLEEAQAGIDLLQSSGESKTHPPARARAEAMANGWKNAQEMHRQRNERDGEETGSTNEPAKTTPVTKHELHKQDLSKYIEHTLSCTSNSTIIYLMSNTF